LSALFELTLASPPERSSACTSSTAMP